ncbi:RPE1 domain protein [Rickettsia felis str. Pedreira]|uniref:RPE1 domain protein n=1 Tax=Rickettsia felis str. Pedreira TaxID=1359196 RepID=A0A0F3MRH1_RICFI|nr:RPE1 domain protein [Rickettsia felis str. Pedreira]
MVREDSSTGSTYKLPLEASYLESFGGGVGYCPRVRNLYSKLRLLL